MEIYKPSTELSYVIESDGNSWFAHYNNFTNIMESEDFAFGDTPQQALENFIKKLDKCTITNHVITNDGQACECGYLVKAEV